MWNDVDSQQEIEALRKENAKLLQIGEERERLSLEQVTGLRSELTRAEQRLLDRDESIRPDTTVESLAKLRPAFGADGLVTAGNAPGINDGAGAVVLMTESRAKALGLTPLAAIVSHGKCGDRTPYLHTVPANAIQGARQGRARPVVCGDPRADRRRVRQSRDTDRRLRNAGATARQHRAARRRLYRRKLQGDAARGIAAGPEG